MYLSMTMIYFPRRNTTMTQMQTAEHDKEIKKGEWCHFEKMMNNEVHMHHVQCSRSVDCWTL